MVALENCPLRNPILDSSPTLYPSEYIIQLALNFKTRTAKLEFLLSYKQFSSFAVIQVKSPSRRKDKRTEREREREGTREREGEGDREKRLGG